MDLLPSGPKWSAQILELEGYQTVEPIIIYKRDAQECVEYLFNNPLFADKMSYRPVKYFTADNKRVVREPASGLQAWQTQVSDAPV